MLFFNKHSAVAWPEAVVTESLQFHMHPVLLHHHHSSLLLTQALVRLCVMQSKENYLSENGWCVTAGTYIYLPSIRMNLQIWPEKVWIVAQVSVKCWVGIWEQMDCKNGLLKSVF